MRNAIKATIRIILIFMFIDLIIILAGQVATLNAYLQAADDFNALRFIALLAGGFVISVLILYLLWIKSDWIVRKIAGEMPDSELIINTTNLDLIKVAMRILGIFLLVKAIPELVGLASYHFSLTEGERLIGQEWSSNEIKNWVTTGAQILFGVWLVLGTRRLVNAIDKVWAGEYLLGKREEK